MKTPITSLLVATFLMLATVATAATGTLTANGSTEWVPASSLPTTAAAQGDFGGGTITLEWSLDRETATAAEDSSGEVARTADTIERIEVRGLYFRWTLTGATNPSINWMIQ